MTILQPVVALIAWTFVMWLWMYVTRLPAMKAANVDANSLASTPGASLDTVLPVEVTWKAKNYNHLHEAPTLFYAVTITLAVLEVGERGALWLAWAYVGLRVIHSLVQATTANVPLRFLVFISSQLVLLGLVVIAALFVF